MNNFQHIQAYFYLQEKSSYDKVIDLPFGKLAYTQSNSSEYENYILVNTVLSDAEIKTLEDEFPALGMYK